MRIVILYNHDFSHLPPSSRKSQEAVVPMVQAFQEALEKHDVDIQVSLLSLDTHPFSIVPALQRENPDLVINFCESLAGDSRGEMLVPGILDLLQIPYTGSGPLALNLALHKHLAKKLLRVSQVSTPDDIFLEINSDLKTVRFPFPAIVKPAHEDASIGIDQFSVVNSFHQLNWACERIWKELRQPVLLEKYIEGRELNVSLLGNPPQVLPISEIDFSALSAKHPKIVTYAAKWDENSESYLATPPVLCKLSPTILQKVIQQATTAFNALQCQDYARVDIRLAPDGNPYVIEVNPNCDLSPDAGFARAAQIAGISYQMLAFRLVETALDRAHEYSSALSERLASSLSNAGKNPRVLPWRGAMRPRTGSTGS